MRIYLPSDAFLGGSSGMGKSVTLNSMLGSIFYEYAPWEAEIMLSDAKIIEFKKYGVGYRVPHITSIAATSDGDYVLSVLNRAFDEMNMRAKIYANIGASNLRSFRKKTGLAVPRIVIVLDEVESTFKNLGKKANKLGDLLDGFARLGRAVGIHIIMATQNMSSDIPKSAIGQIRNRMCLGANPSTSQAVLGNEGAAENVGKIGRLICNTEALSGKNTLPFNIKYQTPFISDDRFTFLMQDLETKGKEIGYRAHMSFYDEEDIKLLSEFSIIQDQVLARMISANEINTRSIPIILGYPSFVLDDEDGLLKIILTHNDVENIVICSNQTDKIGAHLANISHSLRNYFTELHYTSDVSMFEFTPDAVTKQEARDASQRPLNNIGALVQKRLYLLYADNMAKDPRTVKYDQTEVEKLLDQEGIPQSEWGNSLLCRRLVVYNTIKKDAVHASVWKPVQNFFNSFKKYYEECIKYKSLTHPITINDFKKAVFFLGDLSKIIGYGRDNRSSYVTALKKTLQDCNRAAVLFVLYTRSLDSLNDLSSGLRYAIFDAPDSKDWMRMRTEAPGSLNNRLAVLYDSMDPIDSQKKFKCTLLKSEF